MELENPLDMGLTEEESRLLEDMTDPDTVSKTKYSWDQDAQREIVSLLLNDRFFVIQCIDLIKPGYFTNEAHQLATRMAFKHFKKYKQIPSKIQLFQEMQTVLAAKDSKLRVHFFGEINTVYEYYLPGESSRDYYIDKVSYFAKAMSMKSAMIKCIEEAEKAPEDPETYIKCWNIFKDSMSIDRSFDMGLDYFQTADERYLRMQERLDKGEIFITGFKEVDEALSCGGLGRGELGSVVGLSGSGKSLCLVKAAIDNLHIGHKVLYISLEIDQDKVAERIDTQLSNPDPYDADNGINTKNLLENKDKVFEALTSYIKDKEDKQILVVKQFAPGDMDIPSLRAYFAQLHTVNNFRPDLVIIDYVGEMKNYPNMPTWESRQLIVRDLRRFAVEENVCVFTAMQPDRKAKEAIRLGGIIDDDMLADSYGQIRPLDALWSINQTQAEKDCGLARFYVVKHRFGKSRFLVYIQLDYNTLKIRQISQNKYDTIRRHYENTKKVSAADALKMEEEVKAKVDNWKKASIDRKKDKENSTDAYDVLDSVKSEPAITEAGKMFTNDVGYVEDAPDMPDE